MQVSKEFLAEAFGLSLLVALMLIGVHLFQRGTRLTSLLEENQEQQIVQLEEYEIVKYDGLWIDGMTAVNYIKTVTGVYGLPVNVNTVQGTFTVTKQEDYVKLRDISSEFYINPFITYQCEVLRDENGEICKVKLKTEMEGD
ncbi:MAG: hypothetical protein J6J42_14025 [Lachnospiraceae bacterium]|nr:hypothetical protein [Lachnospiraceae bacterium]